jgi:hypothetical protein
VDGVLGYGNLEWWSYQLTLSKNGVRLNKEQKLA